MWWAEFDGIGEETVRANVSRNSYPPTGMESARQWLARREFLQLRGDVQSIRALAEQAQGTASQSLRSASEALTLASAATAAKKTRTMGIVGMVASLVALCALAMVAFRQVVPNTKQASAHRPDQAAVRPLPAAAPTRKGSAILPETAQKTTPSSVHQINPPDLKPQGQTLAQALALIGGKVRSERVVNFTAQFRDIATGRDQYEQRLYKASNVATDQIRCQVRYHWHVERGGRAASDQDRTVDLRLARDIKLTSIGGELGRRFFVRAYPKVYVVNIAERSNASGHNFYFYDRDTAARVVTSAKRAAGLCGGPGAKTAAVRRPLP